MSDILLVLVLLNLAVPASIMCYKENCGNDAQRRKILIPMVLLVGIFLSILIKGIGFSLTSLIAMFILIPLFSLLSWIFFIRKAQANQPCAEVLILTCAILYFILGASMGNIAMILLSLLLGCSPFYA